MDVVGCTRTAANPIRRFEVLAWLTMRCKVTLKTSTKGTIILYHGNIVKDDRHP